MNYFRRLEWRRMIEDLLRDQSSEYLAEAFAAVIEEMDRQCNFRAYSTVFVTTDEAQIVSLIEKMQSLLDAAESLRRPVRSDAHRSTEPQVPGVHGAASNLEQSERQIPVSVRPDQQET